MSEPQAVDTRISVEDDPTDAAVRILGLYEAKMTINDGKLSGKLGELYNALGRRFDLIATESARLSKNMQYMSLLMHFGLKRSEWLMRANLQPFAFHRRTQNAEQKLREWDGKYDLIVQLHTLFAPGLDVTKRPYVIVTDNTYSNTVRYWPKWAPLDSEHQRREWLKLETNVYQNAKYCFTWSEFTRQSFIQDYGIPEDRVVAVGGGSNFVTADLTGKRYDTQTAIFLGYEFERKGGFYLLEAWKKVHRALPNAKLYIIGPRKPLADPMPGVEWVERIDDRDELRRRLTDATVFVMPSLFEPYGHAFTEGMAMGLPVIAADHCAMPEIVRHNETGLLVPPRESEPLADALIQLLSNPDLARQMGHAANEDTKHARSWDDVVTRMAPYIRRAARRES